MMLKGEAIRVVLNDVFYADCSVGTTDRLSGAAIPLHDFRQAIWRQKSLKLAHRLPIPQVSQSPKRGGASQFETLRF